MLCIHNELKIYDTRPKPCWVCSGLILITSRAAYPPAHIWSAWFPVNQWAFILHYFVYCVFFLHFLNTYSAFVTRVYNGSQWVFSLSAYSCVGVFSYLVLTIDDKSSWSLIEIWWLEIWMHKRWFEAPITRLTFNSSFSTRISDAM